MSDITQDPIFDKTVRQYEREYMEELHFDKFRLDEEYEGQPHKYMKWARLYARAITLRKALEIEVDRAKAQADVAIRRHPEKHGLEPDEKGKVMESAIRSCVLLDTRVQELQQALLKAYELGKLFKRALKAFEHRKELLKGEGALWLGEYYGSLSVSREAHEDLVRRKTAREGGMELDLIEDLATEQEGDGGGGHDDV